MRTVNIPKFRKEILKLLDDNREKITSLETNDDNSLITFRGKHYSCEVTLSDQLVAYDLDIQTPDGMMGCGMISDTDIYYEHERITLEIYDDLVATVKAIFDGRLFYSSNDKHSYTAKQKDDGTYSVDHWERRKFLFWPYSEGRTDRIYTKSEFKKLNLKVLN